MKILVTGGAGFIGSHLIDKLLQTDNKVVCIDDLSLGNLENLKLAKSRIKTGLILNEIGLKNNLKVNENEIQGEIQKQLRSMPGQEKMVLEYYQKNPSASQSLKGSLYEEKIIELIKSKINLSLEFILPF